MSDNKNKEHDKLHNKITNRTTTKEEVKLPYLRLSKPLQPNQPNQNLQNQSLQHTFDLYTNHATLPRYEASKDRNLVYFLSKPTNKKIIDEIKQLQTVTKRKHPKTQRQIHQSRSLHLSKEVKKVSKMDFDSYITKMKARVSSSTMQV